MVIIFFFDSSGCGLKGIPVYPLEVRGSRVFAKVPVESQFEDWIDAPMAKRDPKNGTTIGIVGAGASALTAAETLRQVSFYYCCSNEFSCRVGPTAASQLH